MFNMDPTLTQRNTFYSPFRANRHVTEYPSPNEVSIPFNSDIQNDITNRQHHPAAYSAPSDSPPDLLFTTVAHPKLAIEPSRNSIMKDIQDSGKGKIMRKRTKFINQFIIGTVSFFMTESTQFKLNDKMDNSKDIHHLKGKITEVPRVSVRAYYTIKWDIDNDTPKRMKITRGSLQCKISGNNKH